MTPTTTRRHTLAALTAAVVAGSALLSGCDNPPDTIKIGVAQPLSGNLAALGQDLHNGVKMAVDELNKEGFQIKGKPITVLSRGKVIIENDQYVGAKNDGNFLKRGPTIGV